MVSPEIAEPVRPVRTAVPKYAFKYTGIFMDKTACCSSLNAGDRLSTLESPITAATVSMEFSPDPAPVLAEDLMFSICLN